MAKTTKKTVSINTLVVDLNTNVRLANNYDIGSMQQSIVETGRITDPIHARLCDNVVLRGNRRTLAGQALLKDASTPQEVAKALEKCEVIYHDVVAGSDEELSIILDHGTQKRLNRTEVLLTVWRLDKQFFTETKISNMLYLSLAEYTGNTKKAAEAAAIANLKDRQVFVQKWLHGTVGNYILAANKMGAYVRQQMVLTHKAEDKLLAEGEVVECRMSRDRIVALSAAKSADLKAAGWSPELGGEKFNELVEKFKGEDSGTIEKEGSKRPTAKALLERVDSFNSTAIKNALAFAAGDTEKGRDLASLDDTLTRVNDVLAILAKHAPNIKDENVKALIVAILGNGPIGEIEVQLQKFVA
jgi:hypothetical protein